MSRPVWRGFKNQEFIEGQKAFNRWFKENGNEENPRIELLETTKETIEETAVAISAWSKILLKNNYVGVIRETNTETNPSAFNRKAMFLILHRLDWLA